MSNGITGPLTEEQRQEYIEYGLPDNDDIIQGYPSHGPFESVEAAASSLVYDLSADRSVIISLPATVAVTYWAATVEGHDEKQWAQIKEMREEVHRALAEAERRLAPLAAQPCGHGRHPGVSLQIEDYASSFLQLRDVEGVLEYEGIDPDDPEYADDPAEYAEARAEAEEVHREETELWGCPHNLLPLARNALKAITPSLAAIPSSVTSTDTA